MRITLASVRTGVEEERLVLEVLRSGHLTQGPMVSRLEATMAKLIGVEHAVAVSNGTTALVGALKASGVEPGDEVITSPLTFGATLNAILEVGAVARFADLAEDLTIDPDSVAALIGRRTKAILPVHLYGLPADMDSLGPLARNAGLEVIEDACQAVGAHTSAGPAGSFGLGAFSLYATKNIMSGEGGVVTGNDADKIDMLRLFRNQGMRERYVYETRGHNWRLTDLQAAVAVAQLASFDQITKRRRANAQRLTEGLEGLPGLVLPVEPFGRTHVFHLYTVRLEFEAGTTREVLMRRLAERGIEAAPVYPRLVHDYPCFAQHPDVIDEDLPAARRYVPQLLSLPIHPHLSDDDLDQIVEAVHASLGDAR